MLPRLSYLLTIVASAIALITGEEKCHKILERRKNPTEQPVYEHNPENLSFPKCGTRRNDFTIAPWTVKFKGSMRDGICVAILISNTTAISYEENICSLAAKKYSRLKVEIGGQSLAAKIKSVTNITTAAKHNLLRVWTLENVYLRENYTWPICLPNKDSRAEVSYEAHTPDGTLVAADFSKIPSDKCFSDKYKSCDDVDDSFLCVKQGSGYTVGADYLIFKSVNNSYFLRAIIAENSLDRDTIFYLDILPFVDRIVHSAGMYVMPKNEKSSEKIYFNTDGSYPECGTLNKLNAEVNPTIFGGKKADQSDHPWHIALIDDEGIYCGGTLISETVVLTAAHCVEQKENITVIDGINVVPDSFIAKLASQVIVHKDYNEDSYDNDLALLLFDPGFKTSPKVRPICLWNYDYGLDDIKGKSGKIFGWGKTKDQKATENLQTAPITVVRNSDCYETDKSFFTKYLRPGKNFCAGGDGSASCEGDSGGGLVIEKDGKWYLRGLISFGKSIKINTTQQCFAHVPSLYLDVTYYMKWIVDNANIAVIAKPVTSIVTTEIPLPPKPIPAGDVLSENMIMIISITVVVLLVLLGIIFFVCWCCRRKRPANENIPAPEQDIFGDFNLGNAVRSQRTVVTGSRQEGQRIVRTITTTTRSSTQGGLATGATTTTTSTQSSTLPFSSFDADDAFAKLPLMFSKNAAFESDVVFNKDETHKNQSKSK